RQHFLSANVILLGVVDAVHFPAEIRPADCSVSAALSSVPTRPEPDRRWTRRPKSGALGSPRRIRHALPRYRSLGTSTRSESEWLVGLRIENESELWINSTGWALMMAGVLLLAFLRRLDLLLIVAPLSVLFGYRLARVRPGTTRSGARI